MQITVVWEEAIIQTQPAEEDHLSDITQIIHLSPNNDSKSSKPTFADDEWNV